MTLKVKINRPVLKRAVINPNRRPSDYPPPVAWASMNLTFVTMSRFRTELSIDPAPFFLDHQSGIVTVGSCFSETIGQRLRANKFRVAPNPFGTVYNPISIHKLLTYCLGDQTPDASAWLHRGEQWVHPDFHSRFSGTDKPAVTSEIRESLTNTLPYLKSGSTVILTYGTAWVFESVRTGQIVANCHKLPGSDFRRRLLRVDEIVFDFIRLQQLLKHHGVNQIILTVSPVRHVKSTLEGNTVSKSILRTACHELCQGTDSVNYFPAFEIMMDDLRDYRFYAGDMIHPSDVAEAYIWEKFRDAYFSKATRELILKLDELHKALQHRPFHPESAGHIRFLQEVRNKLISLSPQMDVSEELQSIEIQLRKSAL